MYDLQIKHTNNIKYYYGCFVFWVDFFDIKILVNECWIKWLYIFDIFEIEMHTKKSLNIVLFTNK